jgi:cation:H+ antiporter
MLSETLAVLVGTAMLVVGSDRTVMGASTITRERDVSTFFVGVTLVAIGSSLPEIATAIYGAAYRHGSLVVGHVVGPRPPRLPWGSASWRCSRRCRRRGRRSRPTVRRWASRC